MIRRMNNGMADYLGCFYSRALHFVLLMFNKETRASKERRWRSQRGAVLLLPLLFFSSFSFASSLACWVPVDGSGSFPSSPPDTTDPSASCSTLVSSDSGGHANSVSNGPYSTTSNGQCGVFYPNPSYDFNFYYSYLSSCPSSSPYVPPHCSPAPGEPVWASSSFHDAYCDPNTHCESESFTAIVNGSAQNGGVVTNGVSCSAPTSSTTSAASDTSCPAGYSFAPGTSNCECESSSGSFVSATGASGNFDCSSPPSSDLLTPVAPVLSNGQLSCPSGSASSGSGSSLQCLAVPGASNPYVTAPATSVNGVYSCPSGDSSIGSGSSMVCISYSNVPPSPYGSQPSSSPSSSPSNFVTAPATSVNGVYSCPSGDSSIGSGSSLECISGASGSSSGSSSGSGSSTAPTGSGTAPTGSTSSSASYPSSISLPSLPSGGVSSSSIFQFGSLPSVSEVSSQACPAGPTFTVLGKSITFSFKYVCQVASDVRPVVIGAFSLGSLLLLAR